MYAEPRSQFPPLVSHHSPSNLPFTPLCLSFLCHSQSLTTSKSFSTSCHQAVKRSMPFHIYLPLCVSVSLSLIVFFLSILPSHQSHIFFASHSFHAFPLLAPCLLWAFFYVLLFLPISLQSLFPFIFFPSLPLPVLKWV